jgi:hypothetical protein
MDEKRSGKILELKVGTIQTSISRCLVKGGGPGWGEWVHIATDVKLWNDYDFSTLGTSAEHSKTSFDSRSRETLHATGRFGQAERFEHTDGPGYSAAATVSRTCVSALPPW